MSEKAKKQANPAVLQAVKAIAVLVIICLVCVLLLALCNDLLYIDDNTRLERAMQKVYSSFVLDKEVAVTGTSSNPAYGQINKIYLSKDGAYIIESKGVGGYQNGSVTLYVVVGSDAKIKAWAVKENDKQSYIDRVPSSAGTTWYVGEDVSNTLDLVMTGATVVLTSTAINNAINMAALYCRTELGLGKNPEGDAQAAVTELLSSNGLDGYTLSSINVSSATVDGSKSVVDALSDADNTLSFLFLGKGASDNLFAYVYGEEENIKLVVVTSDSVLHSDNVTGEEEFYANIIANPIYTFGYGSYQAYAIVTSVVEGDSVVYTVAGLKVGVTPKTYVLEITILTENGAGIVSAINMTANGYVPGAPSEGDANKLLTSLVGATLANIETKYNDKVSGATQSANLIRVAVEAALTHYDANFASVND